MDSIPLPMTSFCIVAFLHLHNRNSLTPYSKN